MLWAALIFCSILPHETFFEIRVSKLKKSWSNCQSGAYLQVDSIQCWCSGNVKINFGGVRKMKRGSTRRRRKQMTTVEEEVTVDADLSGIQKPTVKV